MSRLDRRTLLLAAGASAATPKIAAAEPAAFVDLPFTNGRRPLVRYPQKRPLIRLTTRPPQLETPFAVFDEGSLTPNDAFFVRYHLGGAPPRIDPAAWRLQIGGAVDKPLEIDLAALRGHFPVRETIAVLQCSGNGRGFFEPRVGGGQAANGLMGMARWRGVPLKALLEAAGVRRSAVQVSFRGADDPPLPTIPPFVKALDLGHAVDGEVMVAFEMNGAALPVLNGYPARLVVPGWYGTYWVKHLTHIELLDKPFDGFWMQSAYRIPADDCACVDPGAAPIATVPINRLNLRSFITSPASGAKVAADRPLRLRGFAFDGGRGLARVEVSGDGGSTWRPAQFGPDLGRYAPRSWTATLTPPAGEVRLQVRAFDANGASQPSRPRWNPGGYMNNAIETVTVRAA
ncbi:MAG TPA: molybdopterin-dependent oxidoreductase [Caulobacteraceae bacterium]|nr:molybdopterin-dependent oxidoreductase [Caulobacteraceae bacterium]